jgi:hypothetical protein
MSIQDIGSLGEFVAALATVITLIYLSAQIKQNNLITKAQFGHGLTQRLYDRFFNTAKDKEFAEFIAKDWAAEDLGDSETSRVTWFSIMLLVDVFDVYDKVKQGLVEEKHLDMRVHMLSTGIFRSPIGNRVWKFWSSVRDEEFVTWFENNVLNPTAAKEKMEKLRTENPELYGTDKSGNTSFRGLESEVD